MSTPRPRNGSTDTGPTVTPGPGPAMTGPGRSGSTPAAPVSGSRNARLRWTGPGPAGPCTASACARTASGLQVARCSSEGTPGDTAHLVAAPNRPTCSIVCGAPVSCNSGGRSAVHTMSGTRPWCASTTAAWSSAAAVPLVTQTTAGRRVARATPSA